MLRPSTFTEGNSGAGGLASQGRTDTNQEWALRYWRLGWMPIPLCWPTAEGKCACGRGHPDKQVGKAPLLGKGYQELRPVQQEVSRWWGVWPLANIGILLAPSGLLVADADGSAGVQELDGQTPLPAGPVSRTGGGGLHRWYLAPQDVGGRSIKRGVSRSLDVLAAGYVVAPPSCHSSGRAYHWLSDPWVSAPPSAPEWAIDLLTKPMHAISPVAGSCSLPAPGAGVITALPHLFGRSIAEWSDARPVSVPQRSSVCRHCRPGAPRLG